MPRKLAIPRVRTPNPELVLDHVEGVSRNAEHPSPLDGSVNKTRLKPPPVTTAVKPEVAQARVASLVVAPRDLAGAVDEGGQDCRDVCP